MEDTIEKLDQGMIHLLVSMERGFQGQIQLRARALYLNRKI